jgi:hypothetical protein
VLLWYHLFMTASVLNLSIEQGATFRLDFIFGVPNRNEAGEVILNEDGSASMAGVADFTGASARMQIRKGYGKDILLSLTSEEGGGITLGATPGAVSVLASAADTDALIVRKARYDLEIEWEGGAVDRILSGSVAVSANITRDDNVSA